MCLLKKIKRNSIKIISVLLVASLMLGLYAYAVSASKEGYSTNMAIYENLLNERSYVINTFTQESFPANNPNAIAQGVAGQNYMYRDMLEQYTNDTKFFRLQSIAA